MKQPLLHPRTKLQLDIYLKQQPHGAILVGPSGIGKNYVAHFLSNELNQEIHIIGKPEKQSSIGIDQVRSLYSLTKTGREQVVLIDNAHLMGKDAQNAFLKLLEEPPENTSFILTVNSADALLPTIRSRAQKIDVLQPSEQQFVKFADDNSEAFVQKVRIQNQLPGKVFSLVSDSETATTFDMDAAKKFYMQGSYQRHLWLISEKYEKNAIQNLLENLTLIIQSLLKAKSADKKTLSKLIKQAQLLDQIKQATQKMPGNPKIHLTKLAEML